MVNYIDAALLRKCFIVGAKKLDANKEFINELNVFPVPDGDTGTNMSMTLLTAANAIAPLEGADMHTVVKAMSGGSLRGARGNSGVIMSQLIRGFCKTADDYDELDAEVIALAAKRAVDTAYKAVMKPKEGTILTVAKGLSDKMTELVEGCLEREALELEVSWLEGSEPEGAVPAEGESEGSTPEVKEPDLVDILTEVIRYGDEVLQKTPDMLPVLKEAGVVDSGGQGLIIFLEGALKAIKGEDSDIGLGDEIQRPASRGAEGQVREKISTDDIKFGYCTEFIVNLDSPLSDEKVNEFKTFLESIGDSIVCVADDELVKVHVHTNHPGLAFEEGLKLGASLSRMKVDNMREEHDEKLIENASRIAAMDSIKKNREVKAEAKPRKPVGFVSVCTGDGLAEIFRSLGVDYVIQGGQTMNPSTDDILKAVESINADDIFVLPNNKNIILAAEQASHICETSRIHVIPTKTIAQGITAMINYRDGESAENNCSIMTDSTVSIKTGELTYAVRDTYIDGMAIKNGDFMGIGDRGILAVGEVLNETAESMVEKMVDEETSIITVYRGEDIETADAEALCDSLREKYPDIDIDCEYGGQPVYYYIISAE